MHDCLECGKKNLNENAGPCCSECFNKTPVEFDWKFWGTVELALFYVFWDEIKEIVLQSVQQL